MSNNINTVCARGKHKQKGNLREPSQPKKTWKPFMLHAIFYNLYSKIPEAGHQLCTFKRLPYCEMLKGILFITLFTKWLSRGRGRNYCVDEISVYSESCQFKAQFEGKQLMGPLYSYPDSKMRRDTCFVSTSPWMVVRLIVFMYLTVLSVANPDKPFWSDHLAGVHNSAHMEMTGVDTNASCY